MTYLLKIHGSIILTETNVNIREIVSHNCRHFTSHIISLSLSYMVGQSGILSTRSFKSDWDSGFGSGSGSGSDSGSEVTGSSCSSDWEGAGIHSADQRISPE